VFDVDDQSKQDCANGFVFNGLDEGSLSSTLERAMSYYQQSKNTSLPAVFFL
jgi:starch synthase